MDTVTKTIGIRLRLDEEQELEKLFSVFGEGINWSLNEIEKRYQTFLKTYKEIPRNDREVGLCSSCQKEKLLTYQTHDKLHCASCATKMYSEYTVRKEIYGTGKRTVEDDLKDAVYIPNKTHYTMLYAQAYAIWKSYNGWRTKRNRERELLEARIAEYPEKKYLKAAMMIEQKAADIKRERPKLIFRTAKALATKEVYRDFSDREQKEIEKVHDKLLELRRLRRPVHFPQLSRCNTVMLAKSFVKWENAKLYLTLWSKGMQEINYYGNNPKYLFCWDEIPGDDNAKLLNFLKIKSDTEIEKVDDRTVKLIYKTGLILLKLNDEKTKINITVDNESRYELIATSENGVLNVYNKGYLDQYIPLMEQNPVYCNLTRKGDQYYLMYPLPIKVKHPPDIKECDTFVFVSSPTKTGIFGYDNDFVLNSVKWFNTGQLVFAKRIFKEKRASIARRRSSDEKMRKIRRRKKKIIRRGDLERRFVSTFNHQLTRKMIDYVMEQSENPKIILWDVGNGITQNFGRTLNYLKSLWSVVQQQEYLKHKAMQMSIPVVEMLYNKCNDLTCSACGAVQMNGKKTAKVITQLIKNVKNFKCAECSYETSMLINQANNVANLNLP